MSIIRQITRNISFKMIGEIVSRAMSIIFFIVVARILGDERFGLYSFVYAFCSLFMIFLDFGIDKIMIRDISRDRSNTRFYLGNITVFKLLLSLLAFFLITLMIKLLNYPDETRRLVILGSGLIIGTGLVEFLVSGMNSWERMDLEALLRIVNRAFIVVFGISALLAGNNLDVFIGSMVLGYLVTVLYGFYLLRKNIDSFRLLFDSGFFVDMIKRSFPLALSTVFVIIYFRADIVMLSLFKRANSEIGWYAAGIKIVDTLGVMPFLITGGLFPVLSKMGKDDLVRMKKYFSDFFIILFFMGLGFSVGGMMVSTKLSLFLFGSDFKNTGTAFSVMSWSMIFVFINYLITNMLIIIDKQKFVAYSAAVGVPLNLALNYFLIPRYGYMGAAWATVVTESVVCSAAFYFIYRAGFHLKRFSVYGKAVLSAAVMAGCIYLLREQHVLFMIFSGSVAYITFFWLIRGLDLNVLRGGV